MNTSVYQYHNNTLCVRAPGLIKSNQSEDGLISEHVWNDWIKRHHANLVQRGGNGRVSLIEFCTIPVKYRDLIKTTFGDPEKKARYSYFVDLVQPNEKAAQFFIAHKTDNGDELPKKHIASYTLNACILDAITVHHANMKKARGRSGKRITGYWTLVSNLLQEIKKEEPRFKDHSLPKSPTALKRKYDQYIAQGFESLISGKFCNSNTLKITEEIGVWIVKEMCMTRKSIEKIHDEYVQKAFQMGFRRDITVHAFRRFVNRPDIAEKIFVARHGDKAWAKVKGISMRLQKPKFANDLWYGDGTGTGWVYRTEDGAVGYATSYFVTDAASNKILGHATNEKIGTENFQLQLRAFKDALRNAGYYRPYEISVDNQKGHKRAEFKNYAEKIAKSGRITYSKAYRSKGRNIERTFDSFQGMMLSKYWFWSGKGRHTHSNLDNAPNSELIYKNIDNLPTFEELTQLLDLAVAEWNDLQYKGRQSPNEIYDQQREQGEKALMLEQIGNLFWSTSSPRKYSAYGINLQIGKQKHVFEVYNENGDIDFEFRKKHLGHSFYIQYDPDFEFDEVFLLEATPNGDTRRVAKAAPKREVSRSAKYHNPGDRAWIETQMQNEEQEPERIMQELEDQYGYTEDEKLTSWKADIGRKPEAVIIEDDDEDVKSIIKKLM
ncbi:MAG: hypothetical protein EP346_06865 [Bacteroidetes bacterium]|nr:MAG: hypothetical protein EP346_06865 [Bacteroidota bacterium]